MNTILVILSLGLLSCVTTNSTESKVDSLKIKSIWTQNKGFSQPESTYYDAISNFIYVSNVAGAPDEKDGKGWISKLSPDGKVIKAQWVKSLNAPKGIRVHGNDLWVADINEVVRISVKTGKVLSKTKIKGAQILNDIDIDASGTLYVSDTFAEKIFVIKKSKVSTFASGATLEHPNGLLLDSGRLIVAAWGSGLNKKTWATKIPGHVYAIDLKTKKKTLITKKPLGNLDGIEKSRTGDYLVTDWVAGKAYSISAKGEVTTIIGGLNGAADLGVNNKSGLVVIPNMGKDEVVGYR